MKLGLPAAELVLERDETDSRISARRRAVLSGARLPIPGAVLEVGAFDNPTVRTRDGFIVRYADYFSADELRRKHASNPRRDASRIVDVDYVIKGPRLSPFIRERFDMVVANHVIEHICDPIGWLCDVAELCNERAAIFMAVPDQRYTFDYFKQPSDITSIVRAFEEKKVQPDVYDVARMRYLHTRVDAAALWEGLSVPERPRAPAYRKIIEGARADASRGYADVHCTFYTTESFLHIFSELFRSKYIPWRVELLADVDRGGNEFYVLLKLEQP